MENNHDCLVVVQSLYYKSASKHILKGVRHRNTARKGLEPQKAQELKREKETD